MRLLFDVGEWVEWLKPSEDTSGCVHLSTVAAEFVHGRVVGCDYATVAIYCERRFNTQRVELSWVEFAPVNQVTRVPVVST